jgi:uncharacterized protein YbjT (DUF2867 family)
VNGSILVTGGTGTLGRAVVNRLTDGGSEIRVLSRHPGPGRVVGDLSTGDGIDAAVRDAAVIVHCATAPRRDVQGTRTLVQAARRAGEPHLVFISIVGVDRVPLAHFREKLAVEELVSSSGLPWTILRATQFHDLLAAKFSRLARTGLMPVLAGTDFQPVEVREVAGRLVELATGEPAGRVADFAGPQIRPMAQLARAWLASTGRHRLVVPLRVPGALARSLRDGGLLAPQHPDGAVTFEDFLAQRPMRSRR